MAATSLGQHLVETSVTDYCRGQRVRVRGDVWDVEEIRSFDGIAVLDLCGAENPARRLRVVAGVEEVEVLAAPELPRVLAPYRDWRIFHDAILAGMQPPPGILSGIDRARLTPEDYQLVPLIRAFRRPLQRLLIADDVGLGKTVEAILVMLELKARLRGERVLIVAPAGLQDQWSDELVEKTGLAFEIFDSERIREIQQQHQRGENPWMLRHHVITSIDYVKRPDVRRRLRDVRWDLVIVDEAHYLAETSSAGKRYRTARSRFGEFIAKQTDSLILLTATPHTGDPQSLFSLVQLVDDRLVATPKEMTRERIAPIVIRRYKGDIRDPHDAAQSRFPGIKVQTVDVPFASAAERDLYARIDRYTKRQWKRAGADSAVGFAMTVIKKRSISSRTALLNTLERRLSTLLEQPVDLRVAKQGLLADYRAGVPLTEQQQAAAEDQVLCAPPVEAEDRNQERRELERLIAAAKTLPEEEEGKAQRLVHELQDLTASKATGRCEKVIVFTEFRDTHAFLERYLSVRGFEGRIATLTGLHTRQQRIEQIERFSRPEIDVLLATDAASEGLNLQEHCRVLIHYELPWNPNRMEQRNGRVHRYGQRRPVIVMNLSLSETLDARILNLLLEKTEQIRRDLGSASDVIGVMQAVSWEELLMGAPGVADGRGDGEVERARAVIEERTEREKAEVRAWEDAQLGPRCVFDAGAAEEIHRVLAVSRARRLSPERRAMLVERAVRLFGGDCLTNGDGSVRILIPQRLRAGLDHEIPRAAFDAAGVPRDHRRVEMIGGLHPLLHAISTAAHGALYDGSSPFAAMRTSAKIARVGNAGVLFTFSIQYRAGNGRTYAEEMLPVFVPEAAPASDDAIRDEALLTSDGLPGKPIAGTVERIAAGVLATRRDEAQTEALRRARTVAEAFERAERERVQAMLDDLERWRVEKRSWLEAQLALPPTQMALVLDEDAAVRHREEVELCRRQRLRFEQELALLDMQAEQRRQALLARSAIEPPDRADVVGALIIVPEFEAQAVSA